ncbi:MAG: iron-sulfur cluster assembly scaffold protein [Patescibacteria group bacterium]
MLLEYENLLALANRQSRRGLMADFSTSATAVNASCGDECTVWLKIADDEIVDVSFETKGCVISRASAAAISDAVIGPIGQIGLMNGNSIRSLLGVAVSPLRERCLTTPLKALQDAISKL